MIQSDAYSRYRQYAFDGYNPEPTRICLNLSEYIPAYLEGGSIDRWLPCGFDTDPDPIGRYMIMEFYDSIAVMALEEIGSDVNAQDAAMEVIGELYRMLGDTYINQVSQELAAIAFERFKTVGFDNRLRYFRDDAELVFDDITLVDCLDNHSVDALERYCIVICEWLTEVLAEFFKGGQYIASSHISNDRSRLFIEFNWP